MAKVSLELVSGGGDKEVRVYRVTSTGEILAPQDFTPLVNGNVGVGIKLKDTPTDTP